jgi:alkanesulfonate monooxygenase SsuD/methylene tetrahydromethanopterin reductase-like flavin-dependent oxidoreductase (luciferase family)
MQLAFDVPVQFPDPSEDIDQLFPQAVECAKLADQIGFDMFTLAEHHFNDYFVQPTPLVLATHLAAVTSVPRILVSVFVLPYHDVQRLAGEIAMTDQLTRGKLEIGFGRGGAQFEADRFNIPHDKSREIFEDRFKALLVLFSGKDVSYEGPYTKFTTLTIMPPPFQKPHPPIWKSIIDPKLAYYCARDGYGVICGLLRRPFSVAVESKQAFDQGIAELKDKSKKPRIALYQWVYVAKDEVEVKRTLETAYRSHQKFMNHYVTPGYVVGGITQPIEIDGTPEDLRNNLIIGTPDFCVDRLLELKSLGYDDYSIRMNFGPNHQDVMRSLDRFGEHVYPHLGHSRVRKAA